MKKLLVISLLLVGSAFVSVHAQELSAIRGYGNYNIAQGFNDGVTKAEGAGSGFELRFKLSEMFDIGLSGAYHTLKVEQPNAITLWKWDFWENRNKNSIASDLLNPDLSADISSAQRMEEYPILLSARANFEVAEGLVVSPVVGGGVLFFVRSLDIIEKWQRVYPTTGYVFKYEYKNFAPKKTGNPLIAIGGFDISYAFSDIVSVYGSGRYQYFVPTDNTMGYKALPYDAVLQGSIGLEFRY